MHPQTTLRMRTHGQHGCPAVPLTSKRRPLRITTPARAQASLPLVPPPPPNPPSPPRPAALAATPATSTTTTPSTTTTLAAAPTPHEAVEILFAGYSDIAERLKKAHTRIEQLEQQRQPANSKPAAAAASPWDAALFLLFFLAFVNFAGWLALWQAQSAIAAAGPPWWAALAPGGTGLALAGRAAASPPLLAVVLKRLVLFFVPLTNTAVVLTFCAAAMRAALACLRAWE